MDATWVCKIGWKTPRCYRRCAATQSCCTQLFMEDLKSCFGQLALTWQIRAETFQGSGFLNLYLKTSFYSTSVKPFWYHAWQKHRPLAWDTFQTGYLRNVFPLSSLRRRNLQTVSSRYTNDRSGDTFFCLDILLLSIWYFCLSSKSDKLPHLRILAKGFD